MSNLKERESNFELLRLVAMFFIVLYHLLLWFIVKYDNNVIYRAMYLPLHVAVLCFVMISGYFHIKPSFRGLVKLIFPLIIFYLPLTIVGYFFFDIGGIRDIFFFSKSPYWFIRTYLYLFLFAPILNVFLTTTKRRLYLLVTLGFIAVYMGTMHDAALLDGKNLVMFMLLYVLGDMLHVYQDMLAKIKMRPLIITYIMLNISLVTAYMCLFGNIFGKALWRLSYPYCSPILIINAIIFFVIFSKIKIRSSIVNNLSGSVFTIYILHHQSLIVNKVLKPFCMGMYEGFSNNPFLVLIFLVCITIITMLFSIVLDKLFQPIIYQMVSAAGRLDEKGYFQL